LDSKIFLQYNFILVVEVGAEGPYEGVKETMIINNFGIA